MVETAGTRFELLKWFITGDEIFIRASITNKSIESGFISKPRYKVKLYTRGGKLVDTEPNVGFKIIEKGQTAVIEVDSKFNPFFDKDNFRDGFIITLLDQSMEFMQITSTPEGNSGFFITGSVNPSLIPKDAIQPEISIDPAQGTYTEEITRADAREGDKFSLFSGDSGGGLKLFGAGAGTAVIAIIAIAALT